jgi:hypothetical protein
LAIDALREKARYLAGDHMAPRSPRIMMIPMPP